jgi:sterol desaturase/sphingolipid hydroxylase (fatty acid hydroxylase superfamily)
MDWQLLLKIAVLTGGRYFVIAGVAFLVFFILFKARYSSRRIQAQHPEWTDYQREVGYSILTILIFSAVPAFLLSNPAIAPHTTYYGDISRYGMAYFWLAFPLMAIMHDTYFYWTHRLMHHRKLFKLFHLVHHRSVNPSPWAAYSFHPLEAVVEVGIVVIFLFTIPVHTLHLVFFFLFMIVYNVYGHLGYELYPRGFSDNAVGRWINTSVSHNMHHQHFKQNYGLYFTFWDRVMGTLHTDYGKRFEEVTSASPKPTPPAAQHEVLT